MNQSYIIPSKMKIKLVFLLLLMIIVSCKNKEDVSYTPLSFKNDKCTECAKVAIDIFEFKNETKLGEVINNVLREEVINQLDYEGTIKNATIEDAITGFKKEFQELKSKYPDETMDWEAIIKSEITFENKDVLTIMLDTYIFTGGAHGHSSLSFLNFNKKKDELFENWQFFKEKDDFKHFAEVKFRIQEDIPQNGAINSTGFMFEEDTFYLPANIGFTQKGLQLIYNQYEVASYADGPIIMTLPYNEVQKYLSVNTKKE